MHYKSIFISDFHLGTKGCQADALCHFLKHNTCDNLFLVGDIIDGWRLNKAWYFPQNHVNVIRRVFTAAKRGTNVYYLVGNHDEAFRKFLSFDIAMGNIHMLDRMDYVGVDGKRYLIIHGDYFDELMLSSKWLMHIGDNLYNFMIWFNTYFNKIRKYFNLPYWSLSNWLKQNTKQALNFIHNFEDKVAEYCKDNNYDGVVCGHIHTAEIKNINGIRYMNDGDWVESGSALVEHLDGTFELIWQKGDYVKNTTDN